VGTTIAKHPPGTPLHFYITSGGNAGLACILAAAKLGATCTVVVPILTSAMMIEKLRNAGAAAVIQHGATWKDADDHLRQAVMSSEVTDIYVPPFDHEDIWAGNETTVPEIERQLGELPDAIVCSVGGGGLFSGIMQGLASASTALTKTRVVTVETRGTDSLYQAVEAGKPVTLPGITSIAISLGVAQVCERAFRFGLQDNVKSVVVTDREAVQGCLRLAQDERLLVEPACGATAIMCYGRLKAILPDLAPDSKVVIVVCGGCNVTLGMLSQWMKDLKIPELDYGM
jgi:L-serine/L-threonine ammonia-lyase